MVPLDDLASCNFLIESEPDLFSPADIEQWRRDDDSIAQIKRRRLEKYLIWQRRVQDRVALHGLQRWLQCYLEGLYARVVGTLCQLHPLNRHALVHLYDWVGTEAARRLPSGAARAPLRH